MRIMSARNRVSSSSYIMLSVSASLCAADPAVFMMILQTKSKNIVFHVRPPILGQR